ncbi:uncharacterized protein si:ch211-91p5.3 isoform X2 [Alosa sapidissima]|uniref:uncharacterized protein si:ch211-91p5.3 isoform X2 n=1 Tax=Alosa sapidissima TaxID=34773 RepID=UPI001C09E159|nr:uncharacterized protein si:ch211-91p5.3 isoform X2 [Alosa sapidissima]
MARFGDDNYRNWLKTTESLNTLRVGLRSFLENETETYHRSLQHKLGNRLKGATCQNKCDGNKWQNKKPYCDVCTPWSDEILANHIGAKNMVYWKNCLPHLWPNEKWEVAKVHMPQGHREHTIYDHFDIAALLNLMGHCTHFRKFIKDQHTNKVIHVRNCVMHSPDFTMSQQEFQQHLEKIKDFARLLDQNVQDLKMLPNEIEKIIDTVDKGLQGHGTEGKQKNNSDALQQKCMEMEQKALKEKIEFLMQRYEENQDGVKEEIEGIKTFLQKNEDLKEKLAPQLEQLQRRVDEHEKQINVLNERVDQLEVKVTQGPKKDPLFSMNPLKYKNYVFELARKYGWPEPVFTESLEGDGYRGHVEVNGLTFSGEQACLNKKLAHQEVAKKALDHLQTLAPSAEVHTGEEQQTKHPVEPSESSTSEGCMSGQDPAKTASQYYYGSVIVVLDTEVASEEGCGQEKEAIEAAYGKLAHLFGLDEAKAGSSKQGLVQEHFQERGFPPPAENSSKGPDETFYCKLKLCGAFTFHDQEGSTKKKQAEHQAAKTALQQLSRVLDWTASGENYKGDLKERLEAQSLGQPSYDVTKKESLSGGERGPSVAMAGCEPAGSSNMNLPPGGTSAPNSIGQPSAAELKPQPTKPDPAVVAPMIPQVIVNEPSVINMEVCSTETDRQLQDVDMSPSRVSGNGTQSVPVKEESTSTSVEGTRYYGSVTVVLDTELQDQDGQLQEGDAIESAYGKLAESFGLDKAKPGSSRAVVHMYFERSGYPLPVENVQKCIDDKIRCSLKLCGSFTFVDQEGSTKKKQAAHQAAKTALQRLSKVLDWTASGENYKGDLKERLEAQGLGQPSYDVTKKESLSGGERGRSVALAGREPAGSSNMSLPPGGTSAPNSKDKPSAAELKPQPTNPDPAVVAPMIPTTGSSPPPVHRKQAKLQFQGEKVERLLVLLGLLPPVVTCEKYSMEQRFTCSVSVQLDQYTFRSPDCTKSKKEASRKAFHSFGLATGICRPGADETCSTQEVKQYFAKRSLPCPIEEFGGKEKAFSCSLTNVSCKLVYEGQGSTEGDACQAAFQDAFTKLGRLFGLSGIPGAPDKADEQLTAMLKMAGQGEPACSLKAQQYKASIQLKFTDYKLEHKSSTNKKQARNYLSERILKMLGVDTDASTSRSLRNSLDEWCKQKKLPEPKFEEMKELLGVQVTFSAPFSCSSHDWEDSWQQAEQSLLQELTARLSWNKEDGTSSSGSSSL